MNVTPSGKIDDFVWSLPFRSHAAIQYLLLQQLNVGLEILEDDSTSPFTPANAGQIDAELPSQFPNRRGRWGPESSKRAFLDTFSFLASRFLLD